MTTADAAAVQAEDQRVLAAFSVPLALAGATLWITWLNDRSIDALWRGDAAVHTLRIEAANTGMAFSVSGLATRPLRIDPHTALEQDGHHLDGQVVNITYLNGQLAPAGATLLGLLEFAQAVDTTRPFVFELGGSRAPIAFDAALVARWGQVTAPAGRGF